MKLVVVSAGLSVPSSTRLLGDRLAAVAAPAATAPGPPQGERPYSSAAVGLYSRPRWSRTKTASCVARTKRAVHHQA
ncbi:hypothetical protein SMCF_229 [Streptomyces coelicoflavus ZG0656]|nr:hypothetical protein SMCF_229 [Streptomyces coelicoflavus ZG0656]